MRVFVLAKTMRVSPLCFVPVGEALGLFNVIIEWLRDMQMDIVEFVMDSKTTNAFSFAVHKLSDGVQKATNKYGSSCFSFLKNKI
ncbi:transmembrane protein, putative [Medicago truncatula]|uniref:Transmembrane protein, putative n=1 Tax=Medicago truncatula TaxID=3880 RepID=G7KNN0_MEDTR|nr:transmembrane protein, putative [Medicago truncatula]